MPFWGGSGGGGGGIASSAVTGATIGSVIPGVGTAIGAGVGALYGGFKKLFANRGAKAKAKIDNENNRLLMQHGIDTRNLSRKRKASMVGSLLRTWAANPKVYGNFVKPDMFGYTPGPLTENDLVDPKAPTLQAGGSSDLSAFLGGAAEGVGGFLSDDQAARNEELGRIQGAGQPVRYS